MDICFFRVRGLFRTISNAECTCLVVSTVRARNELFVFLLEGKPGFKVEFLRCGIIQGARNYRNNLIGESKGLIELLRSGDHFVKHFPGIFRFRENKLFNLLLREFFGVVALVGAYV